MPIYDYLCRDCGQRTEVIHGIDAPGPKFCPACGAEGTLRKAFVAPTVHFKGSGWAKKDRSTASRTRSRSDGESGSSDGADRPAKGSEGDGPAKDAAGIDAKAGSGGSGGSGGSDGSGSSRSSDSSRNSGSSGSGAPGSRAASSEAGSGKGTGKLTSSKED